MFCDRCSPLPRVLLPIALACVALAATSSTSRAHPRTLAPTPSVPLSVLAAPGYCNSSGGSGLYERITNVTLTRLPGNALRVQVDVFIANPTGCTAGAECPEYDSSPEYVNAWIDWNGDRTWDASEKVMDQAGSGYLNINYNGTMTFITTVVIPSTAAGETYLRANLGWSFDPNDPCELSWTWGNVFDRIVRFERLAVTKISSQGSETPIDAITDPIWETTFGPSPECQLQAPSTPEPFAGGFSGAGPTLRVELGACPALPSFTPRVDYRWTIPATPGAAQTTGTGSFTGLTGNIPLTLPRAVGKTRVDLEFSIFDNFGDLVTADRVEQQATVPLYVGYAPKLGVIPKQTWLDKTTAWAGGATTRQAVASRLVSGIYGNGGWLYRDPGADWQPLLEGTANRGNCFTMSNLWKASMDMLGASGAAIAPQVRGTMGMGFLTRTSNRQSFDPGQAGNAHPPAAAIDRWFFGMHQVGTLSGVYYDPTFNNNGFSPLTAFVQYNVTGVLPGGYRATEGNFRLYGLPTSAPWGDVVYEPIPPLLALASNSTAAVSAVWESGPTFMLVDSEADGVAERLRVLGRVAVTGDAVSQGLFSIRGQVEQSGTFITDRPSQGSMLPASVALGPVGVGSYEVQLEFSGEDIRSLAAPGVLTARLWLSDDAGDPLDELAGDTPAYGAGQFGESPAYLQSLSDFGRDDDADGTFDVIVVRASIRASRAVTGLLRAAFHLPGSPDPIAESSADVTLVSGDQSGDVALGAAAVLLSGATGPFDMVVTLTDAEGNVLSTRTGVSQVYVASQLDPPPLEFVGGPSDQGLDTNGNDLFESLAIDVPVQVNTAGEYLATGLLSLGGNQLLGSAEATSMPAGPGMLRLRFAGASLQSSGIDGPYTLQSLLVTDAEGVLTARLAAPYNTAPYLAADFEPPAAPLVSFLGLPTVEEVDSDSDGLIDSLLLSVPVQVSRTGNVVASALLFTNDGQFVEQASTFRPAVAGVPLTLSVPFNGRRIHARGEGGPYHFQNLYVYQTGDPTNGIERVKARVTPAYSVDQFERGPMVQVTVRTAIGTVIPFASLYLSPFSDAGTTDLQGRIRLLVAGSGGNSTVVNLQSVSGYNDIDWQILVDGVPAGTGRSVSVAPAANQVVDVVFEYTGTQVLLDAPRPGQSVRGVMLSEASPNPATRVSGTRLHYRMPARSTGSATLCDLTGRAVRRWELDEASASGELWIGRSSGDAASLPAGLYLLRIEVRKPDGDVVRLGRKLTLLD